MLEPQRMDRVLIVGTKDVMETTINTLHKLDVLHVEDYIEEGDYFRIGKPLKSATSLSEKLLKLRSMRSYLGTNGTPQAKQKRDKVLHDLEQNLASLEKTLTEKMNEKSSLESSLKDLAHREELLKPYESLGLQMQLLHGYENLAVFTGTVPKDIEPQVKNITGDYELFSAPYGKNFVIALFVPKAVGPQVSEILLKNDFIEIEPLKESGEPAAIKKSITEKTAELKAKLEEINKEIKALNQKYSDFILASEELLTIDTQKAEAPLKFATSENTFIVDGWVPTKDYEKLKDTLVKATDDKIYITKVEPEHEAYKSEVEPKAKAKEHHEVDAPVAYNNPRAFKNWQTFIDLVARPKYDEIDPTMIFGIVFPMFYGFILGDMGYGLLLLILCLILRNVFKKSEGYLLLVNVMLICSITSIFFGALFGEFFGFNMAESGFLGISLASIYPHAVTIGPIGPFSLPIERLLPGGFNAQGSYVFGIKDLLVLTCIIGVCQILLGYAFGFRNEYKQHGLKMAILHKVSWVFVLLGGVALVWYIFPLMMVQEIGQVNPSNPLFMGGAASLLIGLVLLLMGEGAMGIIEITTLVSNILSYTRLLAVGLSSVGIAFAINTIATMLSHGGMIGLVAAVLVFILGHSVNLVLGIYAPFIQSLRLHYVEFFMKFYQGGGKIYDPFGYNRKYTED